MNKGCEYDICDECEEVYCSYHPKHIAIDDLGRTLWDDLSSPYDSSTYKRVIKDNGSIVFVKKEDLKPIVNRIPCFSEGVKK